MINSLSRETLGLILGTIGVIIFGDTLPMTRIAVQSLDPWFVTSGRAALAGFVAVLVLSVLRRPWLRRDEVIPFAIGAFFMIIGFPVCTGFAMQLVPDSHGGVVLGILPLVVALFGALSSGDRPSLGFWVSAVVIGLPFTLPIALLTTPSAPSSVPVTHWGAFIYLGLMSQYIGFFFWNSGLAFDGQARVSQTQLLQAFVTLATATLFNGEVIDLWTWFFAVAVVGTVLIGR